MAIYSYLCNYCGHEFDEIVRSSDPEETRYHKCRCGSKAEKLPSIPSSPRGSFGTAPRRGKDKPQEFRFNSDGQGEFDFEGSEE